VTVKLMVGLTKGQPRMPAMQSGHRQIEIAVAAAAIPGHGPTGRVPVAALMADGESAKAPKVRWVAMAARSCHRACAAQAGHARSAVGKVRIKGQSASLVGRSLTL
jgi:hypothetical protein